jgi:hypothetical protein
MSEGKAIGGVFGHAALAWLFMALAGCGGEDPEPSASGTIGSADRATAFRGEDLRRGSGWAGDAAVAGWRDD